MLTVHYAGWLADGTQFDSSKEKRTLSVTLGKKRSWRLGRGAARHESGARASYRPRNFAYGETAPGHIREASSPSSGAARGFLKHVSRPAKPRRQDAERQRAPGKIEEAPFLVRKLARAASAASRNF